MKRYIEQRIPFVNEAITAELEAKRKSWGGYAYKTQRIISGNQLELEIYSVFPKGLKMPDEFVEPKPTSEKQKSLSDRNSRKRLERKIHCNFVPGDYLVTLTFHPSFVPDDLEDVKREFVNYLSRINYRLDKLGLEHAKYVYVLEEVNSKALAGFNHRSNTCPGMNMNLLRGGLVAAVEVPAVESRVHVVVAGDTLERIARDNHTTVAELAAMNGIENVNLIRVGQRLKLPESSSGISVGDIVRVRKDATHWATGERIAGWVLGNEFEVLQVRNGGREVLLGGVMSWISVKKVRKS